MAVWCSKRGALSKRSRASAPCLDRNDRSLPSTCAGEEASPPSRGRDFLSEYSVRSASGMPTGFSQERTPQSLMYGVSGSASLCVSGALMSAKPFVTPSGTPVDSRASVRNLSPERAFVPRSGRLSFPVAPRTAGRAIRQAATPSVSRTRSSSFARPRAASSLAQLSDRIERCLRMGSGLVPRMIMAPEGRMPCATGIGTRDALVLRDHSSLWISPRMPEFT